MDDFEQVRRRFKLWCMQPLRKVDWERVIGLLSALLLCIVFWMAVYVYWRG